MPRDIKYHRVMEWEYGLADHLLTLIILNAPFASRFLPHNAKVSIPVSRPEYEEPPLIHPLLRS
ncbi:hypothetical protein I7I53_07442 [Histoplasma capsulatum var. duboisii H88]|uniref:Uncharacterized protein n=1 Tax=Ajellomyces capsulatus (strain H88) TaxID=544711 RepID=A0A8A1LDS1_AJEC8|nr:hypothetical protein I7I53_07442 [Histoplasma capsulatum var. duboisii H88]